MREGLEIPPAPYGHRQAPGLIQHNSQQSTCSKRRAERCPSVFVRFRFTFPLLLEAGAFLSYCVSDKLAKECTKVNWARARDRDHD